MGLPVPIRLALEFLAAWGGSADWEPWFSRYADRHPADLRKASVPHLRATMARAGADIRAVLDRVDGLGDGAAQADPVRLLSNCPANHTHRRALFSEHARRKLRSSAGQRQAGFQTSGSSARTCFGLLAAGRRRKTSHK